MALTLRTVTADDLAEFQRVLDAAFLADTTEEQLERWRGIFEPERGTTPCSTETSSSAAGASRPGT